MNDGHAVAVDGLKIEPLSENLSGVDGREHAWPTSLSTTSNLCTNRSTTASGRLRRSRRYGITVALG